MAMMRMMTFQTSNMKVRSQLTVVFYLSNINKNINKECDESFKTFSDLVERRKIHIKQHLYQCKYCEKANYNSSNLIKHERSHTGEPPHRCEYSIHYGKRKMF